MLLHHSQSIVTFIRCNKINIKPINWYWMSNKQQQRIWSISRSVCILFLEYLHFYLFKHIQPIHLYTVHNQNLDCNKHANNYACICLHFIRKVYVCRYTTTNHTTIVMRYIECEFWFRKYCLYRISVHAFIWIFNVYLACMDMLYMHPISNTILASHAILLMLFSVFFFHPKKIVKELSFFDAAAVIVEDSRLNSLCIVQITTSIPKQNPKTKRKKKCL